MHSADDLVMCLGELNGHVGRPTDGYGGVHNGNGIGESNFEERMLLKLCLDKE